VFTYVGITTTIKHAIKLTIKLKTSPGPTRLAQLLQRMQPSLAFCCKLQPMTAYRDAVIGCNLQQMLMRAATVVQVLQDFCKSFVLSFIACFVVVVITPLQTSEQQTLLVG